MTAATSGSSRPERAPEGVVARARTGDEDAFGELWRAFQGPLLRYFRTRRIRGPEEVASEVWLDVARSLVRFEGDDGDFRGWLFTIAHRRAVDAIRRQVNRPQQLRDPAVETFDTVPAAEDDYLDVSAVDRAIELVRELPDDMAEVVMLRVVNDLPVATVSEITGQSEANVRVLAHRGLKKLAERVTNGST